MPCYLDYLLSRLAAAGVPIEIIQLHSLADAMHAPVVVNCAGVGAGELAGDPTVTPIRGQHVVLSNPGIDDVFMELSVAPE